MVRTAKRIDSTDACDTSTYSIAIIEVPNLSLVSVDIGNRQPSTTTTIGFFTRDPIGYADGWNLYPAKFIVSRVDPSGRKVVPWTNPPWAPFQGGCKLRYRCWEIFAGEKHCGLVMEVDGRLFTIDGTGGSENHFNWREDDPYLPWVEGEDQGEWKDVPIETCNCLREQSVSWNSKNVPRNTLTCNSNTSLRCLSSKCNVTLEFFPRSPFRYDECDKYKCLQYGPRPNCFSSKPCIKWRSFCEWGWGGGGEFPDTPWDPPSQTLWPML